MKLVCLFFLMVLLPHFEAAAQNTVSGRVTDGKAPLTGANIFIYGTIEGTTADSAGHFCFYTNRKGKVTLMMTCIGYETDSLTANAENMKGLNIVMRPKSLSIDEVTVTASAFHFGKSENFKTMGALDIVLAGNSCGDIYAALQSLPGTQKVGENGKLYVRGGESDECQTFVNGMHVLVPYTATAGNTAVRGRFSPFLFKGINFSLGGYNGEYGQALSSVLPMETTDAAASDKLGFSVSPLDWNLGGTKSLHGSSLSFNASYSDMGLYNKVFPDRLDWTSPYRQLSGEAQYKREVNTIGMFKSYIGYDRTTFAQRMDNREMLFNEHNFYANATYKWTAAHGCSFFAGIANSSVFNKIDGAKTRNDHYDNIRNEIHLKACMNKSMSSAFKISTGMEDYVRHSRMEYETSQDLSHHYTLDYHVFATFANAQLRMARHLYMNLSARMENAGYAYNWNVMPRTAFSFIPNHHLQFTASWGRYSQTAKDDDIALSGKQMHQSFADHAIIGLQYNHQQTLLRIEAYDKQYRHLPLLENGKYTANGYGHSRGLDVYVENTSLISRVDMTLAYSYNDSKRLYLDFEEPRTPHYATKHNLRMTAKYSIDKLKTIVGMAYSFASGRPYHLIASTTEKRNVSNGFTPSYHSLDANLTFLVHPKMIVYASMNNILGRKNIFGYRYAADGTTRMPVTSSRNRFFYIVILVSLKNNKAYDISNF